MGVALLNGLITFVRSLCVTKVSEHSAMTLRNELYDHLQNVPYDYHKHSSVGDLVQRCSSDVETDPGSQAAQQGDQDAQKNGVARAQQTAEIEDDIKPADDGRNSQYVEQHGRHDFDFLPDP